MSKFEILMEDALALPSEERLKMAELLMDSVHDDVVDPEIQNAWDEEIARRIADYDAGRTHAIPIEQAMKDAREGLKRRCK